MHISDFRKVKVAIVGTGPGSVGAAREVARATRDFVLIDTACEAGFAGADGITAARVLIDRANAVQREHRAGAGAVARRAGPDADASGCLREGMFDAIGAESPGHASGCLLHGDARLIGTNHIHVDGCIVEADAIVVIVGRRPRLPGQWRSFADHMTRPQQLLASERLPKAVAVVGLGGEGLAVAQALRRLGVDVSGFHPTTDLADIADPDIAAEALAVFDREFPVVVGHRVRVRRRQDGRVQVAAGSVTAAVDRVWLNDGDNPEVVGIGWKEIGVPLDRNGIPEHDPGTLRVPGTSVFVVGADGAAHASPQRLVVEGRTAGFNAVHAELRRVSPFTPLTVVSADPCIATVGAPLQHHDPDRLVTTKHRFGQPTGRAAGGLSGGVIKLYAQRHSRRLLGGAMLGRDCDHLAHLLAAFVEQGLSVDRALQMPFCHASAEERLREGLERLGAVLDRSRCASTGAATGPLPLRVVARSGERRRRDKRDDS